MCDEFNGHSVGMSNNGREVLKDTEVAYNCSATLIVFVGWPQFCTFDYFLTGRGALSYEHGRSNHKPGKP